MENKLENLKEKMDETIFRDISFEDKHYYKVLHSIKNHEHNSSRLSPLKNKFNMVLSMSVISVIALGITYFVGMQINSPSGSEKTQIDKPKEDTNESVTKPLDSETEYVPPVQEENYDDMTKEEILTKMINTVDYFKTASGQYKMHYGHIPAEYEVEYNISIGEIPGGVSKTTEAVNGKKVVNSEYYLGGSVWSLSEETKTFREFKYADYDNFGQPITLDEAFSGNDVTYYRGRPPIGVANETLFPYEIASNYTRDLNSWEIEKQNEELLGHNTLVIKGNKIHRDFQSFRFWVDKDTGILVKYETYNSAGEVVDYLHPTRLEINIPIDSKQFTPNLDSYKESPELNDEPKVTTGNIDEFIPQEIKKQWDEAKKTPNETTLIRFNQQYDQWFIFVEKGYVLDRIEADGKAGFVYITKASSEKSQYNFHVLAEGYKVDTLKIVRE